MRQNCSLREASTKMLRWPFVLCALAEERRPNANTRSAFFNCQRKIAAHAHREYIEVQPRIHCRPLVSPLTQTAEACARHCLLCAPRGDCHEAPHFEMSQLREPIQKLRSLT